MRRLIAALLAALILPLAGCSSTGEVENQAYALVLGVESASGGGIILTIRIPRIGRTGTNGGEGGSEPYLVISAEGAGYAQALERLQWAAARELNLSHLKLIIVSRELAASEAFPALIQTIAETRHLYTTAGFIVCNGSAKAFIEGQEIILGTRLSSEITAMFRHFASHGAISRSTFADLYYLTLSGLGDPTGIWGTLDADEPPQAEQQAAAIIGADAGLRDAQTASARQYLGAAVFRDGRLAMRLDAADTLCLNLLTAKLDSFTWTHGRNACILSCARRPGCRVDIDGDVIRLTASVWLTCECDASREFLDAMETDMALVLTDIVRRCLDAGVEPFGFTERAAAKFFTLDAWQNYRWRDRMANAEIDITVHIA